MTVRKATGGLNLFATVRGDSITTDGFTADLSAATDAATYQLDYLVVLDERGWTLARRQWRRDKTVAEWGLCDLGARAGEPSAGHGDVSRGGTGERCGRVFALRLDGAAFPGRHAVVLRARDAGAGARVGAGGGPALPPGGAVVVSGESGFPAGVADRRTARRRRWSPTNKSRLILGQKADGTKLATGAAIPEVLAYAIGAGRAADGGNDHAECDRALRGGAGPIRARTVIRHFLRWTPDAMAAFDYTTAPFPTLSILQRSASGDGDAAGLRRADVRAGADAAPRFADAGGGAEIRADERYRQRHVHVADRCRPRRPTATGNELGALVMTLDLAGARATYQKQAVRTAAIPQSATSGGVIAWWKGKFRVAGDFADERPDDRGRDADGGDRESGELSGRHAGATAERVAGGLAWRRG